MTTVSYEFATKSRQRRNVFLLLGASVAFVLTVAAAGWIGGLRINTTPSEPVGLWRIVTLSRSVAVGDVVFVCPPDNVITREARNRGYLRVGLCPGRYAPLIKTVIAVEGQRVDIVDTVDIDGVQIENSSVYERDGRGRVLRRDLGGIVRYGEIVLHSDFPGSWDSRYFGPVPVAGVLGLAQEVLTYAP